MADQHITIADSAPRVQYQVGSAGQSDFAVPFPFFDLTDIEVYVASEKKAYGSDYTVTGTVGRTGGYPGGTVRLIAGVNNTTVTVLRRVPLARTTDFPEIGKFNIRALNTQLDRLIAITQQLRDDDTRGIRLAPSATVPELTLDPPIADQYLKYDSTGTRIISTSIAPGGGSGGGGGLPSIQPGQEGFFLRANTAGTGYELASEFRGKEFKVQYVNPAPNETWPIFALATELEIPRTGTLNGIRFRGPIDVGGIVNYAGLNMEADNIGTFTYAGHLYADAYINGGERVRVIDFGGNEVNCRRDFRIQKQHTGPAGLGAVMRIQNIRIGGALANDYLDIRGQFRDQTNVTRGMSGWSVVCEDNTLGAEKYRYDFWLVYGGVGKSRWRMADGLWASSLTNKGDGAAHLKALFLNDVPMESAGLTRGWLRCDSAGAIISSHNVESVTVLGTGRRRVNLLNDFGSGNYGFAFGLLEAAAANQSIGVENGTSPAAGTIDIATRNAAGTLTDIAFSAVFFSTDADAPAEQAAAATINDLVAEDGTAMVAEDGTQLVIDA